MQLQMGTKLEQHVGEIILPTVTRLGCDLVRVKLMEGDKRRTLQIMIEKTEGGNTTVEHCAEVSNMISPLLDVEDPIDGEYHLEVSTPGIDRPLTRKEDFERFKGHEVKITTRHPVNNRRKFTGRLLNIDENEIVTVSVPDAADEVASIEGDNIVSAKLVLTDELIDALNMAIGANDNNNK